jgi:hypothetical protein
LLPYCTVQTHEAQFSSVLQLREEQVCPSGASKSFPRLSERKGLKRCYISF